MNFKGKSAILMVVFYVFRLLFLPHQSFAQERKVQVNFIFEVSLWASSSPLEIHLLQNNILISGSTGMPVGTASAHKVSTEKRLALLRTFVGDRSRTDDLFPESFRDSKRSTFFQLTTQYIFCSFWL